MSELLAQLEWRAPAWFWLALVPWLAWGVRAVLAGRRDSDYADTALLPWARALPHGGLTWQRRLLAAWRPLAHALGWLLMAAAMAGPRVAETIHDRDRDSAPALYVLLDVSRSMTASDVTPNRLQRALLELDDLIVRADNLRIGLIAFAARPHLMLPPTADKGLLRHTLHRLRYGLMPTAGSDPAAALQFALRQFADDGAAHALLLVGDGELRVDSAAAREEWEAAVAMLRTRGITLSALGVGTVEGAPLRDAHGDWLHADGNPVVSHLAAARLAAAARADGGGYAEVADSDAEWRTLYDEHLRRLGGDARTREGRRLIEWRELYVGCLLPAIVLLLLARIDGRQRPRDAAVSGLRAATAALLVGAALYAPPPRADDATQLRQAHAAYLAGDLTAAQRTYARVTGYAGRMGEGISAYRAGDYAAALHAFGEAVLAADDDTARARAVFDLGNVRYRMHDYALAVDMYREALRYTPQDAAAQVNLQWAEFRLDYQQARERAQRDARSEAGRGRGNAEGPTTLGDDPTVSDGKGSSRDRPPSALPDPPDGTLENAGAAGAQGSQPVVVRGAAFRDDDWIYAPTSPQRIVHEASALTVDQSLVWKRLFESDEGFPAPVETPRPVPGMRSW